MEKQEGWREGSKVVIDYDFRRIQIVVVGDFDVSKARRCRDFIFRVFEESSFPFDLLIDITKEHKSARGTRKVWREINAHPRVRYVALCGVSSFAMRIHTFTLRFNKHPKLRMFRSRNEANEWMTTLIFDVKNWFDASKGALPVNREDVIISVEGVNYTGKYVALKKAFVVESELREMLFNIEMHQVYWMHYERSRTGKIESLEI